VIDFLNLGSNKKSALAGSANINYSFGDDSFGDVVLDFHTVLYTAYTDVLS